MKAVIVAGGMGTRIKSINSDVPKPLIQIGNQSLLEHNFELFRENGVEDIVLALGHKAEMISGKVGNGWKYGVNVQYAYDPKPLGDLGAYKHACDLFGLEGTVILSSGDDLVKGLPVDKMHEFHQSHGGDITIAMTLQKDRKGKQIFEVNPDGQVTRFIYEDAHLADTWSNYCSTGFYMFSDKGREQIPEGKALSGELVSKFAESGKLYGFFYDGIHFNVGTPEIYNDAHRGLRDWNNRINTCPQNREHR